MTENTNVMDVPLRSIATDELAEILGYSVDLPNFPR